MFERLRFHLLRLLRVPPDPEPPAGAHGSLRVFRAGGNFYKLRLLRWVLGQFGALAGIIFSIVMLGRLEDGLPSLRSSAATAQPAAMAPAANPGDSSEIQPRPPEAKSERKRSRDGRASLTRLAARWPGWVFPVLKLVELGAILLFLLQIPVTYAMVRLDYELRWYLVTDRSLRIRAGLTTVQESTMSFANLQQVVVTQGPVQRLLGLADVRVQSAGGGGDEEAKGGGASLHTGVFHGVEHASQIRDLILERLRRYRETGLGDPDDRSAAISVPTATTPPGETALAAARELLAETKALRQALGAKPANSSRS